MDLQQHTVGQIKHVEIYDLFNQVCVGLWPISKYHQTLLPYSIGSVQVDLFGTSIKYIKVDRGISHKCSLLQEPPIHFLQSVLGLEDSPSLPLNVELSWTSHSIQ